MRVDLVLALRSLARRPLFTVAVTLTIGGALAATAVAFALIDGVLLRPLPFATPDRLVTIWERSTEVIGERNTVSPANYRAWNEGLTTVEDLAAVFETSAALSGDGEPLQVGVVYSAGPLFSLIGGAPLVGRYYGVAEDAEDGPAVVVISERLWRARFGGARSTVGRTITVNGRPREIIGVLPSALDFAPARSWGGVGSRDLYIPLQFSPNQWAATGRYLQVVGRIRTGGTLAAVREETIALTDRLRAQYPERLTGWTVNPVLLRDDIVGDVGTLLTIVFAAVGLVLLVACANVANLFMVRSAERRNELAVRAALGAGRLDLARQIFGESTLLALLGGIAGIGLSVWGLSALVAGAPDLPRADQVRVDLRMLLFLVGATVVVAGLIGIGPAIATAGRDPSGWLMQRGGVGDRRATRARRVFVAVQVAFSAVLVIGAGLLVRSLVNRMAVDLGFDPRHVATAQVELRGDRYRDPAVRVATFEQLVARVAALPGVTAVSAASIVPMSDKAQATDFVVLDRPLPPAGQRPVADVRFVHHDYFATMRIGLRAGRLLEANDRAGRPPVVVINAAGAAKLWPNENAIGKRIMMAWGDTLTAEVVGVVADVRLEAPDRPVDRATLYWDYRQTGVPGDLALVVRGDRAVPALAPIRAALAEIDPNLPLYNSTSMERLRSDTLAQSRFTALTLALFSLLALGLAALGVYGVMAYGVQQRSREIGVRLALGAGRGAVVRMLLRDAARAVGPGLVAGAIGAVALSGVLRNLVFGITPSDPAVVGGSLILVVVVALLASWIPARRGAAAPPADAMRAD